MIKFILKEGLEGYEMTREIRADYLNAGDVLEKDEEAVHIAGYENGKVICSGRMYVKDAITCVIDNVIVDNDNRHQYVGDTILRALEDKAVQMMKAIIRVTPTADAREFFIHEGYTGEKEMVKDLTFVRGCRCTGGKKNE